ncbi:MAG: LPXTG cell wall anchor domain-containing protein [Stomatobaculum sp.]|nr:LPXTG cell wall anchor domain-containing protein [Stomatobaculum sp.]
MTVINTIGYTMPSTGGPGTRAISIIGLLLVLMGGSYLLIRRQRELLE